VTPEEQVSLRDYIERELTHVNEKIDHVGDDVAAIKAVVGNVVTWRALAAAITLAITLCGLVVMILQ
jgi:phage-related minor tail protein